MENYLYLFLLPFLAVLTVVFIYVAIKGNIIGSVASKDLYPFYTKWDVRRATKYYINTKFQNIDPSYYDDLNDSNLYVAKAKLIPFFLTNVFKNDVGDKRFYLILGDAGMGKTTFLINLYSKYKQQLFGQKYNIRLLPLAFSEIDSIIKNIDNKENTILLLDGFDEDIKASANFQKRINELSELTWQFRSTIITCRTQFFPSESEEPNQTTIQKFGVDKGYYTFNRTYISPFDNSDLKKYLNKKYSIFQLKRKKSAIKLIRQISNLAVRPLFLSYIDEIINSNDLLFTNSFTLYKNLVDKWIERESLLIENHERILFKRNLFDFSKRLAFEIFNTGNYKLDLLKIEQISKEYNNPLSKIEITSRSLLNRDAEGHYKFSHKSIFEFMLAEFLIENPEDISQKDLSEYHLTYELLKDKASWKN